MSLIENRNLKNYKQMNHLSKYLIIFLLLLTVSGCLMGPKYEKPVVNTRGNFKYDSIKVDTVIDLKWWELFNDSELKKLITICLEENQDLQVAASRVEVARLNAGINKADYWPKFDIQGGGLGGNYFGNLFNSNGYAAVGAVNMNWEIDFWGKIRRLNEAARAELFASEYGKRSLQISLISEVAYQYFVLLDYKWRLEISKQAMQLRKESLDIIQARFDQGYSPEIDLNQAQIQWAIAAASVPQYERLIGRTENLISVLIGRNPDFIRTGTNLENQAIPPDIPPGIPSTILYRRPDIAEAEQLLIAQNARIGVAQASRMPAISLTGLLGVSSNQLSGVTTAGLAWNAGASVLGPLFYFNQNLKRVDIEREFYTQENRFYETTILAAFREVEDALIDIKTFKNELEIRERQYQAAANAQNLSLERYDKGVTSYLEVLESQRSAFDAELVYAQTRQALLNSYVNLYKALGGGWISEAEEQAAKNPPPAE
jgi:outer membrane protein, multidrug efflux system